LGDKKDDEEKNEVDEHTCKPEDVATAKMLAKDSKNCPKCGVCIFKIEGCNQMFCTHCNTAFCWKTLEIINRAIHNPHYFEWVKRNENNNFSQSENNTCLGETVNFLDNSSLLVNRIRNKFRVIENFNNYNVPPPARKLMELVAKFIESVNHTTGSYIHLRYYLAKDNSDVRKKFLTNLIDEEYLKNIMYKRYCKNRIRKFSQEIVQMLKTAAGDLLNWIDSRVGESIADSCLDLLYKDAKKAMKELVQHYNDSMIKLHQTYKSEQDIHVIKCTDNNQFLYTLTVDRHNYQQKLL
jgi:uncharacterized Zn finger protein (UPF0148 family)